MKKHGQERGTICLYTGEGGGKTTNASSTEVRRAGSQGCNNSVSKMVEKHWRIQNKKEAVPRISDTPVRKKGLERTKQSSARAMKETGN